MPARPLGLVHAPINGGRVGFIGPRLHFILKRLSRGSDS
jgi:hypothetical protein